MKADKRTDGEMPIVLKTCISLLSEHFHIYHIMSSSQQPYEIQSISIHKWGPSIDWAVCLTSLSHVSKWSVCRHRQRSLPLAHISALSHCHSEPVSVWMLFPASFLPCLFLSQATCWSPCIGPTGVPYQLPWKIPTATFYPSNPFAFRGSGGSLVLGAKNRTYSWRLYLLKFTVILFLLQQLLHHKPKKVWKLNNFQVIWTF